MFKSWRSWQWMCLGIWINHTTLLEASLFLQIHEDRMSHSTCQSNECLHEREDRPHLSAAIDGYSVFCMLILGVMQVFKHLLRQLSKKTTMDKILLHFRSYRKCNDQSCSACLMKISLSLLCPNGLYFKLNLSNRWKIFLSACISRLSMFKS